MEKSYKMQQMYFLYLFKSWKRQNKFNAKRGRGISLPKKKSNSINDLEYDKIVFSLYIQYAPSYVTITHHIDILRILHFHFFSILQILLKIEKEWVVKNRPSFIKSFKYTRFLARAFFLVLAKIGMNQIRSTWSLH